MSNMRTGKMIVDEDDFKIIAHEGNQVAGWSRLIFNGQATNAWESNDLGTPEQAIEVYPGLSHEIKAATEE
jgi:hypothetical protein